MWAHGVTLVSSPLRSGTSPNISSFFQAKPAGFVFRIQKFDQWLSTATFLPDMNLFTSHINCFFLEVYTFFIQRLSMEIYPLLLWTKQIIDTWKATYFIHLNMYMWTLYLYLKLTWVTLFSPHWLRRIIILSYQPVGQMKFKHTWR